MSILYTRQNSRPAPLPFRLRMPDGSTRTSPATFTPEEIAAAGYLEAPPKPEHDAATQELMWADGAWQVRDFTREEIVAKIRPVTPRQFRLALLKAGIDLAAIDTAVEKDYGAWIEWNFATEIKRQHPLVDSLAAKLKKTPEEVDQVFALATTY